MLTYISLFSSAGIGCYGLNDIGFTCIATAELLEKRLQIQRLNQKCKYSTGYISGDLSSLETHRQLYEEVDSFKNKEAISDIDLIVATPPCQGMSVANHKKKKEISRNSLVVESIKIVKNLKPKFFIFENVSTFLNAICTDIDGQDKPIKQAINENLSCEYYIEKRVLNFKNYGSKSSRTRTLCIGSRRDIRGITPLDLFPEFSSEDTLKDVIGHLPRLKTMGQFSEDDIYHSFRPYKVEMHPWICATKYGESAFDNECQHLRPHQLVNGKIVPNKNKNGDKYKRQTWEKVAPCIHTRNDCLPSQNTIHPEDDRVFSIRELMLVMSIPNSFKWVDDSLIPNMTDDEKIKSAFRKKFEFNIRQCIGEAVPTKVITNIGENISKWSKISHFTKREINELIDKKNLSETNNLLNFIKENHSNISMEDMYEICEISNSERLNTAAFYTRRPICYAALEHISLTNQNTIRVLEPSVGVGSFIPLIVKKYQGKKIIIDCVDINVDSLKLSKLLAEKYIKTDNVVLNFYHADFLEWEPQSKTRYDLVVGNPPYMKVKDSSKLMSYRKHCINRKTNNTFAFFIEKSIRISKIVSLIIPKSVLNGPEYSETRRVMENTTFIHINDFNEKAFDVKIETISISLQTTKPKKGSIFSVYSYSNKTFIEKEQDYVFHEFFNSWLLYRNEIFDNICKKLEFGKFKVFRDRQITKKHTKNSGKYRVIKSRNIGNGKILDIPNYDSFIDSIDNFSVGKYLNKEVILVPNLTYNPRAARLPKNCITDGSAAILYTDCGITDDDIAYFSTDEFKIFYRIARNYGTRSMNIDSIAVNYFGLRKSD